MEEAVSIPAGAIELEGLLSLPPGAAIGAVVCHPHPLYGGEMRNNVVSALVEGLGAAGCATLRFNFRGVGRSGGSHDDGRGEQDDVKAAVSFLLSRGQFGDVIVAGYSFGSFVGLEAGAADERVHKLLGVALPLARRDAAFLEGVAKPKLLIGGDRDDISPEAKARELFGRLMEPKSLVMIAGADHFFAGHESRIAEAAAGFVARGAG